MKKYGRYFQDMFTFIFRHAILLDEFIELISGYKLIKYEADRGILHKYRIIAEECKSDTKKCDGIMKEFNLNKFSYMFDGAGLFIEDFLKRFSKVLDMILDKKKMPKLFKRKQQSFTKNTFEK